MSRAIVGHETTHQMLVHVELDDGRRITFDLFFEIGDRIDYEANRDKELLCKAHVLGTAIN